MKLLISEIRSKKTAMSALKFALWYASLGYWIDDLISTLRGVSAHLSTP